jgi:hypothetical protein
VEYIHVFVVNRNGCQRRHRYIYILRISKNKAKLLLFHPSTREGGKK